MFALKIHVVDGGNDAAALHDVLNDICLSRRDVCSIDRISEDWFIEGKNELDFSNAYDNIIVFEALTKQEYCVFNSSDGDICVNDRTKNWGDEEKQSKNLIYCLSHAFCDICMQGKMVPAGVGYTDDMAYGSDELSLKKKKNDPNYTLSVAEKIKRKEKLYSIYQNTGGANRERSMKNGTVVLIVSLNILTDHLVTGQEIGWLKLVYQWTDKLEITDTKEKLNWLIALHWRSFIKIEGTENINREINKAITHVIDSSRNNNHPITT